MSMMNTSLRFGFTSANIRFQRCFGIGCLEFEAGYSSTFIDQHMLHTVRRSIDLHTTSTNEMTTYESSATSHLNIVLVSGL